MAEDGLRRPKGRRQADVGQSRPRVQALEAGRGMSILEAGSEATDETASGGVNHPCPPLRFGGGDEPWTSVDNPVEGNAPRTGAREPRGHFLLCVDNGPAKLAADVRMA